MTLTGNGQLHFVGRHADVRYTLHLSAEPSGVLYGDVSDLLRAISASRVVLELVDGRKARVEIRRYQPGSPASFAVLETLVEPAHAA